MSGILEQAIEFLQNQSKSMQTMIGSGGNTESSGGIGSLLSQTPMGGGMDTAPTTQPSTMEIPTPSVTTPPPVTATSPVITPPVNPSTPAPTPTPTPSITSPAPTPTAPVAPPSSLGDMINSFARRPQQTPQERYAGTDIDQGFFDSNEYQQSQQGPQTQDMGYTSDIFGSGLSSSRGRAQDQAYQDYLNRTGQGQGQGSTQGQSIFNNPVMNQPRLLQQPQVLGGSQFAGLGAYQGADQAQLQQLMQQQFGQNQAIPAQAIPAQMSPNNFVRRPRPQVQLPSGATDQQKNMLMQQYQQARQTPTPMQNNFQTGLGQMGGMNNLFGRAFAGKPV